jgi:P pilus assembly chaperone PapD
MKMRISLLALALAIIPAAANAGNFTISRSTVYLDNGNQAQDVRIVNAGTGTARLSVRVYPWTQLPDRGNIKCGSTDPNDPPARPVDVQACEPLSGFTQRATYYPELFELQPGARRDIRVGVCVNQQRLDQNLDAHCVTQTGVEQTYRLVVTELPDPSGAPPHPGMTLEIHARMDMPVFVAPAASVGPPIAKLSTIDVRGGVVQVDLQNQGAVHVPQSILAIAALDATGKTVWRDTVHPFYILAHGSQLMVDQMPKTVCGRTMTLAVRWTLPDNLGQQTTATHDISCR